MRIQGDKTVIFAPEEALDLTLVPEADTLREGLIHKAFLELCLADLAASDDKRWWARISTGDYGEYRITFHDLHRPESSEDQEPADTHMMCPRCGWVGDLFRDADGPRITWLPTDGQRPPSDVCLVCGKRTDKIVETKVWWVCPDTDCGARGIGDSELTMCRREVPPSVFEDSE